MAAANISEAIRDVWGYTAFPNNTAARFAVWMNVFSSISWDRTLQNVRSVTDWEVPSLAFQSTISGTLSVDQVASMVDLVYRTLEAVQAGVAAGDITTAQRDAVVAQYNTAFP